MARQARRALLSVYDKTALVPLAECLRRHGYEILSTGGTARLLKQSGVEVTAVSGHTGAPEILGGRVKTLHPHIAGGLLALRSNDDHMRELDAHGIGTIDVVVVNLYPFEEATGKPDVTLADALENIDIGGPTMIRAAAKNHTAVAAVTSPDDYPAVVAALEANAGAIPDGLRADLAVKAFQRTARYDAMIAKWLGREDAGMPATLAIGGDKQLSLRYGENPHQAACLYRTEASGFGAAHIHQGKELSYNNLVDLDAAVGLARDLGDGSAVIVKHTNPCGAARSGELVEAYRQARATDPLSAFGGVVAIAGEVDEVTARELTSTFIEAVAAPAFAPAALAILAAKKNLRVVEMSFAPPRGLGVRMIAGGLLVQDQDRRTDDDELRVVTKRAPSESELAALRFAWVVAKHVKSNAIVYANDGHTIGIGAGQMSRVDSARIAAQKAVLPLQGTAVASDAFFPFRDGLDQLAEAGATSVIQPGGSMRDDEVIAAADEHNVAMVFTGTRHFRH